MDPSPQRPLAALDERWARTLPARLVRDAIVCGALGACMDWWTTRTVEGRGALDAIDGPVILVGTHGSHMDTPALLRALSRKRRHKTAVTAAADYFYRDRRKAALVSLAFATVPVRRDGTGLDPASSAHLDQLIRDGYSLVIFAEGTRSRDGSVGRLRSGAAVLAARHGIPLVPVAMSGTHEAMPPGQKWMRRDAGRRRPISIAFGSPIRVRDVKQRKDAMEAVRLFFAEAGADTAQDIPPERQRAGAAG